MASQSFKTIKSPLSPNKDPNGSSLFPINQTTNSYQVRKTTCKQKLFLPDKKSLNISDSTSNYAKRNP